MTAERTSKKRHVRLGVNVDHVATIRNARGGKHPDPVRAAIEAARAGADGITAHLREDRRHISDDDIAALRAEIGLPLNLEMAATEEMLQIALSHAPNACCLVPEKRAELTTEGGLDVAAATAYVATYVGALKDAGIRVSLFIDPDQAQLAAASEVAADIVELHTGTYCHAAATGDERAREHEFARLERAASHGAGLGLEIHAGHGLSYDTVGAIARIPEVIELNIGHFIIGEAVFTGLESSVKQMRALIDQARDSGEETV